MKQKRHSPEQVIQQFADGEKLFNPRLPSVRDHRVDLRLIVGNHSLRHFENEVSVHYPWCRWL